MLKGLWIIESNFQRLKKLAEETARVLSHFRPGPDLLEATRTALALCAIVLIGARAVRSLVALQRLPPAPPDTMVRAAAVVLGAAPKDRSALYALCDSDELVAGAANGVVSYFFENVGELDSALKAARRTLEAFEQRKLPYLQAGAHARISELCLQVERGEEARRHLLAALPVLERLGTGPPWSASGGWCSPACRSATSTRRSTGWSRRPRRRRTSRSARSPTASASGPRSCSRAVRSRPACACGGAPSTCWYAEGPIFGVDTDPSEDQWTLEAEAVTVVAHAQHAGSTSSRRSPANCRTGCRRCSPTPSPTRRPT